MAPVLLGLGGAQTRLQGHTLGGPCPRSEASPHARPYSSELPFRPQEDPAFKKSSAQTSDTQPTQPLGPGVVWLRSLTVAQLTCHRPRTTMRKTAETV